MESTNAILAWERIEGKAKIIVRCLLDSSVVHSDEINIEQAAQRNMFAKRVAELGVDRKWADSRLLEIVAEHRVSATHDPMNIPIWRNWKLAMLSGRN